MGVTAAVTADLLVGQERLVMIAMAGGGGNLMALRGWSWRTWRAVSCVSIFARGPIHSRDPLGADLFL